MSPQDFVRTLYLGDRACKAILIDGWNATVRMQVDCISRVRSVSGTWENYTDEDIVDGFVVFEDVDSFELANLGYLPNDSINSVEVIGRHPEHVTIEISIDSVRPDASHHETILRIKCKSLYIEDPSKPGVDIRV